MRVPALIGRRMVRAIILACVALSTSGAAPAAGQGGRDIVIERFEVDVVVLPDAHITVREELALRFEGEWNGIVRSIPVRYHIRGMNFDLRLRLDDVTDERGQPLRHESSRVGRDREIRIWVPGAHDATRVVVLRYRVENALRHFDEADELVWNVTGTEWPYPIESALARVTLPAGVAGVEAIAFTGAFGEEGGDAEWRAEGAAAEFRATRSLRPGEGLTVAVRWEPGIIARPTRAQRARQLFFANWALFLPLLALVGMFRHWRSRGRDPSAPSVPVWYEPPDGMRPGPVGALVDHSAGMREVSATLVDLATRGFLVIEEEESGGIFGIGKQREYSFTPHRERLESWPELEPYERELLVALFGADAAKEGVKISELREDFHKHYGTIHRTIWEEVVERGYYARRPDRVRGSYAVGGVVGGIVVFAIAQAINVALGVEGASALVGGIGTGAVVLAFAWFMPARTAEGTKALALVLGFREFLGRVESDRFRRMIKTPEDFERYLPFAMALGVDDKWDAVFQRIYADPSTRPSWYHGSRGFRAPAFYTSLAPAVSPPSSGGGGGSAFGGGGGGFSGGGFGGGGGRGF